MPYPNPSILDADYIYYMVDYGKTVDLVDGYTARIVDEGGGFYILRVMRGNHHVASHYGYCTTLRKACESVAQQLREGGHPKPCDKEQKPLYSIDFNSPDYSYASTLKAAQEAKGDGPPAEEIMSELKGLSDLVALRDAAAHFAAGFKALEGVGSKLKRRALFDVSTVCATHPVWTQPVTTQPEREALRAFRKTIGGE